MVRDHESVEGEDASKQEVEGQNSVTWESNYLPRAQPGLSYLCLLLSLLFQCQTQYLMDLLYMMDQTLSNVTSAMWMYGLECQPFQMVSKDSRM